MKRILLLLSITLCLTANAQADTTQTDTTETAWDFYAGGILATRNYARGVNFGQGPSIQPYAGVTWKGLTFEVFAAITGNGDYDYGTTHDISLSYEYKGFKVGIHDDYFFSKHGNHNYFFETSSDTMNGHYYEAQLGYTHDKFSVLGGYNFYNTNLPVTGDYLTGVYLEGKYNINDNFTVVLAGLTGPSILNFYDKAGITTIGVEWNRELQLTKNFAADLDVLFHVNPNYKNISPGVQQAPMNVFVSLSF